MFKEHIQKQIQRGRDARPILRISQASLAILIMLSPALIPAPFVSTPETQLASQDTIKNMPGLVTVGWGDAPAALARIPAEFTTDYANLDPITKVTSTLGVVRLEDPKMKNKKAKPQSPVCQKVPVSASVERVGGTKQSFRWVTIELRKDSEGRPYTNVCFHFGDHPQEIGLSKVA